jgi:hypothetical protein
VPKSLLAANVLLLAAAALFVVLMVRTARTPWPAPPPARPRPVPSQSAPAADADAKSAPAPQSYTMIATRNLFSPARTEAPPPTTAPSPAVVLPKPNLYGVIVREDASIAYIEDPQKKKVFAYRLGDAVAGGTVKSIAPDRVTLARPDGDDTILLRDPSRPRPAPQPPAPPAAGAQPPRPAPVTPPVVGAPGVQPGAVPPAVPPAVQPGTSPRRTLPPSLLRRLPTGGPTDAPQQ